MRTLIAALILWTVVSPAVEALDRTGLRVGVESTEPPFAFVNGVGEFDGFNADLARALCARMAVSCLFVSSRIPEFAQKLRTRAVDFALALSITDARRKLMDFTDRLYVAPNRFIVRRGTELDVSASGLAGKRVGVRHGTVQDRYVTTNFPAATIRRYAEKSELFVDLALARLDTVLTEEVASRAQFLGTELGADFDFIGPSLSDPAWFGDGIGMAVRKGDDELRTALNRALEEIRADGTFDAICRRYFTFELNLS